ncbi:MAG: hybrid sensor histidine kinase/response regulator [Nitrospiraceae bacterium]
MSSAFDREALVGIFVAEATDGMATLWTALYPSDDRLPSAEAMQEHHAIGHKLRGAASLYGFTGLAKLGELLETVLEQATAISQGQWPKAVEELRGLIAAFRAQLAIIGGGGAEDGAVVEEWRQRCESLLPASSVQEPSSNGLLAADYLVLNLDAEVLSYFAPEAQEYLDMMDALLHRLSETPQDRDSVQQLCRMAHTLKGSANTVGFRVIGEVAHPIEECMVAVREGRLETTSGLIQAIKQAVDLIKILMKRDPGNLDRLRRDIPAVTMDLQRMAKGEVSSLAGFSSQQPPVVQTTRAALVHPESVKLDQPQVAASESLLDTYLIPALDPEVLSYFAPEAQEYLETLEALLLRLEKDTQNSDIINQLFRTAHTLKGSAYTVGFQAIGDLTHHIEDFMGAVRDGRMRVLPGLTDHILCAVDVVRTLMRRDPSQIDQLRHRFSAVMRDLKKLDALASAGGVRDLPTSGDTAESRDSTEFTSATESETSKTQESKGTEEREVIRVSRDRLERLLNLVGELVIGRGRLEQRLIVLDQLSNQVLACKNRLTDSVRTFEDKHAFTLPSTSPSGKEAMGPVVAGLSDFGSLEFDKYDDFNILSRRISEVTADIGESMSQLSGSIRRAHDDMSELQQLTLGMRDEIARARMVPVGTPFTRFRRATREMARATGKEITLVTSGEHTEVDTGLVERLVDPLIHLVRNAVYHGIEPAATRVAHGKPSTGSVYLHAAHRGSAVIIEVEDDGSGLDLEKIKAKAVARGLVRSEVAETLPEQEVIKFIFLPGFSTADQVGDQAGRGVGLDVVKRVIEAMNGHLEVESIRGTGTKFTLHLPLTLLIATALMVRVENERYAIPLPSVREVTMPSANSIQHMGERTVLHIADEAIEVQPLRALLRRESGLVEGRTPIVIVRTATGPLGLAVDELLGRQEIVIKTLGTLKPFGRSCFGGATIDPEGRVVLVLDIGRLTARDSQYSAALSDETSVPLLPEASVPTDLMGEGKQRDLPILLIDDSLSIRKFVGKMLETAGYQVDTAVDGEEGLRKASDQTYRLIITDLEMPKLNGFEVIQALRSRPQTRATPIMVMTTRAGEKHRQMAINVGATAYIAKPVEERSLIREVERWIGHEAGAQTPIA